MNNILKIDLIDETSKIDVNVIDNTSNIDVSLTNYNDKEVRDDIEELKQTKVDKEEGKALSTNDFTNADKNKLDSLEKYDDTEVRELIDTKQPKGNYLTEESDPTVPNYVKNITQNNIVSWNNKQDKLVSGENIKTINNESILGSGNIDIQSGGSSDHSELDNLDYEHSGHTGFQPAGDYVEDIDYVHTDNNYTDTEKQKLSNLENYDDTEIKENIMDLNNSILTISKIKANKTEIPKNTSDLNNDSGFITKNVNDLTYYTLKTNTGSLIDLEINQTTYVVTLSLKDQDGNVISTDTIDLPLENVVVSGSYDDSSQKIVLTLQNGTTVDIPVGDLVAGLQTEITSSNKIASDLVDDSNSGNKFVTASEKTTWNGKQNAITSSNKLSASLVSGLSTVATSGSYNDLSDKPTIPTQVTESTVSGWGFTKNTGTYIKPSTGIPKTDLASGVQTSLGKADTALQSISSSDVTSALGYTPYDSVNPNGYTSNTGTITGVKMNGSTVASSGVADLGTVITAHQDISGKQDVLVSGANIKTINNQSILGSGNITIESGGTVDTAMSDSSTNAVQNKVIKGYVDDIVGDIGTILDSINGEVIGG